MNKKLKFLMAAFIFVLFMTAAPSLCADEENSAGGKKLYAEPKALEKWQNLSDAEKAKLRSRHQEWKSLDPAKKKEIKKRFKRFEQFSPGKKEKIKKNWRRFKELSPEKRQALRKKYKHQKTL